MQLVNPLTSPPKNKKNKNKTKTKKTPQITKFHYTNNMFLIQQVGGLKRFCFLHQNFGSIFQTGSRVYPIVHHQPLWQASNQAKKKVFLIQGGGGGNPLTPPNPPPKKIWIQRAGGGGGGGLNTPNPPPPPPRQCMRLVGKDHVTPQWNVWFLQMWCQTILKTSKKKVRSIAAESTMV